MPSEQHRKLARKAMKLKWEKGWTLAKAWAYLKKKKRVKVGDKKKRGEPTKKKTKTPPRKKIKTSTDDKKKKRICKGYITVNGKERKIYEGTHGGKYYKSKGAKVYV